MERLTPKHGTSSDLTSHIFMSMLGHTCTSGSFGAVYRCTINTSKGTKEVAVKVFKVNLERAAEKYEKAMRRELEVWLKLSKHHTIVPLLGTADVGFPLPALVSQWMPSGTLYMYLKQGTITASAKAELVMGVADGLKYLHSEDVVHGDLHPGNVLIDESGNPRLIDFGLATVTGDGELQLSTSTANHSFNPRWRAPEVIGIKEDPIRPNFKSDVYSFGGIMFFVISGDPPWKEKKNQPQIITELLKRMTPARPSNIPDNYWNLIQQCWSWEPRDRPVVTKIIESLATKTTVILAMTESTIQATMSHSTARTIHPEAVARTIHPEAAARTIHPEAAARTIHPEAAARTIHPEAAARTIHPEAAARTIHPEAAARTIHPEAAARTRHGTTSRSDTTGLPNRHLPRRIKTVVIFGEPGVGKSSLVNLMAGRELARTDPGMKRCIMQWTDCPISFGGDSYMVYEIVGLDDPELGIREYLECVENAYRLIKELDSKGGIDLLLYCIRTGTRSIHAQIQSNYQLFHEVLFQKKVPIVLVLTNLEREEKMENWWERNQSFFKRYGIRVDGHACITTANGLDRRHRALYDESRIMVRNLVQQFTADSQKPAWTGGDELFVSLMRKLNQLLSIGSRVRRKDVVPVLTKRCGISSDVAKQLAKMITAKP